MANLILIKHSLPAINPSTPSKEWVLSPEGLSRCTWLAEQLLSYRLKQVFSSTEAKAIQTALTISHKLGLSNKSIEGLQENDRTDFPYFENPEAWRQQFRTFFQKPHERCIGDESAVEATVRFSNALNGILSERWQETIAVVTHGTVLTLFTAAHNDISPFELWDSLALPSFVVLDSRTFKLVGGPCSYTSI